MGSADGCGGSNGRGGERVLDEEEVTTAIGVGVVVGVDVGAGVGAGESGRMIACLGATTMPSLLA